MLDATLKQLRIAESRFGQFQETQAAFESITRRLSSCELSPFYDYKYPVGLGGEPDTEAIPLSYELKSDLHFVCGPANTGTWPLFGSGNRLGHAVFFHGAYGQTEDPGLKEMSNLMNSWGYYLEFGPDTPERATFLSLPERNRFRLKELQVPTEEITTFASKLSTQTSPSGLYSWFRTPANATPSRAHTVAENIVAFVITPLAPNATTGEFEPMATDYFFDSRAHQHATLGEPRLEQSRHRLPPILRITLVALDDVSAERLQEESGTAQPNLGMDSLFANPNNYDKDIATLEATLIGRNLRYRVFTTTIRLRNSRWTSTY
jgi:uncharacterized protein (TIGR02599 family)